MNCPYCSAEARGPIALCPACERPLPVRAGESYFDAFGLVSSFGFDRSVLQKKFYELSRLLHPDRFSARANTPAGAGDLKVSLERMSFLNQAFACLRDPLALRAYVIAQAGGAPVKSSPPLDWAEAWFDLQEKILEKVPGVDAEVAQFRKKLMTDRVSLSEDARRAEEQYDQGQQASAVILLMKVQERLSYLSSLERDLNSRAGYAS